LLLNSQISDLTGIEYFTNLIYLNFGQNSITSLNLSQLTQLQRLGCYQNNIASLNLSTLTHLQYLFCQQNQITSLNFSNNPQLTTVYCGNNQISSLDFSANPLFNDLGCRNNQLTSLNIKNGITQLFGAQTYLNECWTGNPNLTSICADAFEIPALQSYLSGCSITQAITIDSACPLLGNEEFEKEKFTISPNPFENEFTVSFDKLVKEVKLELFTLVGQKIYEETIENTNEHTIAIDNLPKGTYLLKLSDGEQTIDKKIIKN
jgi:Leucine-rich repeat (LRR) protein